MRRRAPRLDPHRAAVARPHRKRADVPPAADTDERVEQDPPPRRPGRLIAPAVDPWIERGEAAKRLASATSLESWISAGDPHADYETYIVRLLATEMLLARARRARLRVEAFHEQQRARADAAARELEAIRRGVGAIRRRESCYQTDACRLYLQSQHPKGRRPTDKEVDALARRLRTRKKKTDTTT
jgi:hypothetical protein